MARTSAEPCLHCGARAVRKEARAGRTLPHRMFAALPVPADFAIPSCSRCGAVEIDPQIDAELAPLIAEAYAAELRLRGQFAVAEVCKHISQRRLEKLIGLSQGYLSRLLAGKSTPSATLVALLTFIAREPRQRLREIESIWADDAAAHDDVSDFSGFRQQSPPSRGTT